MARDKKKKPADRYSSWVPDERPPVDAGDEEQAVIRHQAYSLARQREAEGLHQILDTVAGREFIWRILEYSGCESVAPLETNALARYEGRRDVGMWIKNECFTSYPDSYSIMRQEAEEREQLRETQNGG